VVLKRRRSIKPAESDDGSPFAEYLDGASCRIEDRCEALLYQYDRCCDDWRHHDAIIWEMPLAAVTANAVIVWAAASGHRRWQLTMAWAIAALVVGVMSMGLQKQLGYAKQIQRRIREIENEFGLPVVTVQVGRRGLVSSMMTWMLRLLAFADVVVAVLFAFVPHAVM
jgi:hypothetical protein